jgi:hypothetical protein
MQPSVGELDQKGMALFACLHADRCGTNLLMGRVADGGPAPPAVRVGVPTALPPAHSHAH